MTNADAAIDNAAVPPREVSGPSGALRSLTSALALLREPVPAEKKRILRRRWEALEPTVRYPTQGLGRQATGCGATVGAQPRCDFDCTSCYLGEDANLARPLSLDDILRQLDRLRQHLGPKGNVQITDGEITLLPREPLIAILRHARNIGLIPMLMTHGDGFRRDSWVYPGFPTLFWGLSGFPNAILGSFGVFRG